MKNIIETYQKIDQIDKSDTKGQQESDELISGLCDEEKIDLMNLTKGYATHENFMRDMNENKKESIEKRKDVSMEALRQAVGLFNFESELKDKYRAKELAEKQNENAKKLENIAENQDVKPLYNEKEYAELDPEGLAKNYYEKEIQGKELDEAEFAGKINIADNHLGKERGLKKLSVRTADEVFDYARNIAISTLYFSGDRELAQKAIKQCFDLINNSEIVHVRNDDRGCTCSYGESFGFLAQQCGFPELSKLITGSVLCYRSPQYQYYQNAYGVKQYNKECTEEEVKKYVIWEIERLTYSLKKEKNKDTEIK